MPVRNVPDTTTVPMRDRIRPAPIAQVNVDTSASASAVSGLFENVTKLANQSADFSAARTAQEAAATDIRLNPDGVPTLKPGTSIKAYNYNQTSKSLFKLKSDSAMSQHLDGLAEAHKGNPAAYQHWRLLLKPSSPRFRIKIS